MTSPTLRRTAYLLTGDLAAAEDLLQESLVTVYMRRDRISTPTALTAYTRRVLVREAGHRRRRRREHAGASTDPAVDPHPAVEDRVDLVRALAALPMRQRIAVVLRYLHDLSEQETAEAMGTSVGTVKSQTSRGLSALNAVLRQAERSEP